MKKETKIFIGAGHCKVLRCEGEELELEIQIDPDCKDSCCAGLLDRMRNAVSARRVRWLQEDKAVVIRYFSGNHHVGSWIKWNRLSEGDVEIVMERVFGLDYGQRVDVFNWPPGAG